MSIHPEFSWGIHVREFQTDFSLSASKALFCPNKVLSIMIDHHDFLGLFLMGNWSAPWSETGVAGIMHTTRCVGKCFFTGETISRWCWSGHGRNFLSFSLFPPLIVFHDPHESRYSKAGFASDRFILPDSTPGHVAFQRYARL